MKYTDTQLKQIKDYALQITKYVETLTPVENGICVNTFLTHNRDAIEYWSVQSYCDGTNALCVKPKGYQALDLRHIAKESITYIENYANYLFALIEEWKYIKAWLINAIQQQEDRKQEYLSVLKDFEL